ncbi:cell surface protein [Bifidobacterium simiiventris]|uniref:cell surface protein n=1 Tax=Bifidobacterium simiiventris TaxID=2834434 RepID=UPI001C55C7F9|nr:cell surface protein [Bifidobacterium simiiventris]MBW3077906.1 cell surface protein [Bifidobacterium simiiventris]
MAEMDGRRGIAVRLCGVLLAIATALSVLTFALITTPARTAQAATVYGSITIDAQWDRDTANQTALAGDTYAIVRIASADLNAETGTIRAFHTLKSFSKFDQSWAKLTSSELNTAAKQLDAYAVKHKLYSVSDTSNAAGRAYFTDLEPGIYLISRTAAASANKRYSCDPFLIAVPETTGGTLTLAVTAEPKFSDNGTVTPPNPAPQPEKPSNPNKPSEPNEPTTPGNQSTPKNPANTGAAVSIIALAAIALTVAALIIRDLRRGRRVSDQ